MTWWAWLLIWIALVLGAGFVFLVLLRSVWRSASALFRELGRAAENLTTLSEQLEQLERLADDAKRSTPELAVFADPQALRRARDREIRRRVAVGRRQARRAGTARRPPG